jgi:SsrA-binding protein
VSKFNSIISQNRKARYNFEIIEKIEVGIVLHGPEVKSIRAGRIALENSYAIEKKGEFWLMNLYVDLKEYEKNFKDLSNTRPKKLLLNKKEIDKISIKLKQNSFTMIPLDLHFNKKGFIKILLGISKGRKKQDLREYKKQQDWKKVKARLEKV